MSKELYRKRRIVYKAWNYIDKLFVRPDLIPCKRGELHLEGHILLQFTGLYDQQHEEIYEMDLVLLDKAKYVVVWDDVSGWKLITELQTGFESRFSGPEAGRSKRLCSYFESGGNP